MGCSIYVANTSQQAVTSGGNVSMGTAMRRIGRAFAANSGAIEARQCGYASVSICATVAPTAAGTVTLTLLRNGTAVPGAVATAQVATAGDAITVPITAVVKGRSCACDDAALLTLALDGGDATVSNVAVYVSQP